MGEAVFGQETPMRRGLRGVAGEADSAVQQQGSGLMARSQTDANSVVARSREITELSGRLLWNECRSQITCTSKMRERQGVVLIRFRALTGLTRNFGGCDDVAPIASTAQLASQAAAVETRLVDHQMLHRNPRCDGALCALADSLNHSVTAAARTAVAIFN